MPDHLLPPEPYGVTYGGVYEPLVTLSFIAAVTRRVRLGTSIPILPLRDPFLVARQAATLERLFMGPVEFSERAADLRNRAGRPFEAGIRIVWTGDDRPFAEAVAQARAFAAAGADHLAVWFGEAEGFLARMVEFATAFASGG